MVLILGLDAEFAQLSQRFEIVLVSKVGDDRFGDNLTNIGELLELFLGGFGQGLD